jgi:hypothetical protein
VSPTQSIEGPQGLKVQSAGVTMRMDPQRPVYTVEGGANQNDIDVST